MKGIPEEPRCGFSNAVVQIFRMHGVTYDAHDVLKDEELRQGVFCIITNFCCRDPWEESHNLTRQRELCVFHLRNE
jgi:arsenate reductase-like glutaredoxin family protein